MEENGHREVKPPYGTFGAFKGLISRLADTALPDSIDRSMLNSLSGAEQGSLLLCLRFFGLIEGEDNSTSSLLHDLIETRREGEEAFKAAFGALITERYAAIIADLNIENTTKAKLEKCFRNAGLSQGQMLNKGLRFYLKSLEYSGAAVSPHLKVRTRTASRRNAKKQAKVRTQDPGGQPSPTPTSTVPDGFADQPIHGLNGAFIRFPVAMTVADCKRLEATVNYLKELITVEGREG